jgi:cysteine desulfurase
VNNEVGTIQPLEKISEILRSKGVLFHSDCAQAPKTISCVHIAQNVDMASFSGHKIGGPPGIGALFVASNLQEQFTSLIQGGGQQLGLRSGTLPLPLCVGLGTAFELLTLDDFDHDVRKLASLRDYFYEQLVKKEIDITLNGPELNQRHAGNLNITFNGIKAFDLLMAAQPFLAASTGSACGSGQIEQSHVLKALKFSKERADGALRFSFSHRNTTNEIDSALQILEEKISILKSVQMDF